jgi:threonine synthase
MKYRHLDPRAGARAEFCDILLGGLAPDGGLYLPRPIRRFRAPSSTNGARCPITRWPSRAGKKFITDIPACDLRAGRSHLHGAAYRLPSRARCADITPLTTLEPGLHLLELSNGPTLAFKDMAMQLLGNLFEYVLEQARRDHQHPRRHLGRHRLGGRVRHARQARRRSSCSRRTA